MNPRVFMVLVATITPAAVLAQTGGDAKRYDFERDKIGKPPAGFTSYATADGPPGKWIVQEMAGAPSGKYIVVQTDADPTDNRYPVLIANDGEYGAVDVSVKGKALSGKGDQGIGLVFRFRDSKSYYVCRANALEDNFRLYKMVKGRRIQLADANVKVPSQKWHTLRAVSKGDHIVCYFDGKPLIDARDGAYSKGKVGLWTKADSVIAFDDLAVTTP